MNSSSKLSRPSPIQEGWRAVVQCLDDSPAAGLALVTMMACAILLPRLGMLGMFDWDESIYASVARDILTSGDPFRLTLLGEPYLNKPPLFIYLVATSLRIFGETDSAARLTAALFGVANVGVCYLLARRLFGPRVALLSALLLLAHRDFLSVSRHGRMESMVSFFIALSVLALLQARQRKPWLALYVVAVTAAVLTKGPMGLLALVVAAPLWLLDAPLRQSVRWQDATKATLLIMVFSLPWFGYQYLHLGDHYIEGYVHQQGLQRLLTQIEGHQAEPLWYYLHIMFFQNASSWAFLAPVILLWCVQRLRRGGGDGVRIMGIYALVIIGVASLALKTKLPHYTYAAYVPLACIGAVFLQDLGGKARYLRHVVVLLSVLFMVGYQPSLKAKNTDLRDLTAPLHQWCPRELPIMAVGMDRIALHWYADRPVQHVAQWPAAAGHGDSRTRCWVAPAATPMPGHLDWRLVRTSPKSKYVLAISAPTAP